MNEILDNFNGIEFCFLCFGIASIPAWIITLPILIKDLLEERKEIKNNCKDHHINRK